MRQLMSKRLIGGFLPLHLTADRHINNNVWAFWGVNDDNSLRLHNARSCLHYLLTANKVKRLWLPAYICDSLVSAVDNTNTELHYYPLTSKLSPRCDFLHDYLQAGDYVLAINYFGKNPDPDFLHLVNERRDIVWLEDRAQALSPATSTWGDWIIYSPRKVLGVADGGILVAAQTSCSLPNIIATSLTEPDFVVPALLRFEDHDEIHNQVWYEHYQISEQQMRVSSKSMSQLTQTLLAMINPAKLCQQRQSNYRLLAQAFADIAFIDDLEPNFVPLGFPIQLRSADQLWQGLCKQQIFAQRHWLNLPSPADQFSVEHQLSRELITIPCDHRYQAQDMQYIIEVLKKLL